MGKRDLEEIKRGPLYLVKRDQEEIERGPPYFGKKDMKTAPLYLGKRDIEETKRGPQYLGKRALEEIEDMHENKRRPLFLGELNQHQRYFQFACILHFNLINDIRVTHVKKFSSDPETSPVTRG